MSCLCVCNAFGMSGSWSGRVVDPFGRFAASARTIGLAVFAVLLLSGVAHAANVTIDSTNPNGSITITWVDFEGGFTVNGTAYGFPGLHNPTTVTFTPTSTNAQLTFSGSWFTSGGSGGQSELYFVDAGTTHVRDRLTTSTSRACLDCQANITGTFQSDNATNLGTVPEGKTAIAITGSPQELVGN